MYVCMVNIKLKYDFVETPRKFIYMTFGRVNVMFCNNNCWCLLHQIVEVCNLKQ